jgi:hypothetical protein
MIPKLELVAAFYWLAIAVFATAAQSGVIYTNQGLFDAAVAGLPLRWFENFEGFRSRLCARLFPGRLSRHSGFIDSFSFALRNELNDMGVTVTCLMPGATETEFFERAGLADTKVGRAKKDNPADVLNLASRP